MSIAVALEHLKAEAEKMRPSPYFLSASDDGRPHAVLVRIEWVGNALVFGAGNRSKLNVAARPRVSLLFPPREDGGYSLIIDGDATIGDNNQISIHPTRGVLHRPAAPSNMPKEGCGADCVPILG